jgi:hypothetical protein
MAGLVPIVFGLLFCGAPADSGAKRETLLAQLERLAAGAPAPGLEVSFRPAADDCVELAIVAEPQGLGLVCRPAVRGARSHRCHPSHDHDLAAVLSSVAAQGVFARSYGEERPRGAPRFVFRLTDGNAFFEKTFYGAPAALAEVVGRLRALGHDCASSGMSSIAPSASIGTATMTPDGTIVLDLIATGPGATRGEARLVYRPDHKDYRAVLEHLGGLRPGETKSVPPWPDPR